jgi:hypothetical protein
MALRLASMLVSCPLDPIAETGIKVCVFAVSFEVPQPIGIPLSLVRKPSLITSALGGELVVPGIRLPIGDVLLCLRWSIFAFSLRGGI